MQQKQSVILIIRPLFSRGNGAIHLVVIIEELNAIFLVLLASKSIDQITLCVKIKMFLSMLFVTTNL